MGTPGPLAINRFVIANTPFDADKDFAAVSYVADVPNVILANPATGFRNVEDMLAAARARPGQLNWGSPGVGSTGHIALEMLKQRRRSTSSTCRTKARARRPRTYSATDSVRRQTFRTALPHIKGGGKLVALGVMGDRRLPALPGVAPVNATVPGYSLNSWFVVGGAGRHAQTDRRSHQRHHRCHHRNRKWPRSCASSASDSVGARRAAGRASEGRAGAFSRSHRADGSEAGVRKRLAVALLVQGHAFAPLPADMEAFERCNGQAASALDAAQGTATELSAVAALQRRHPHGKS